MVAGHQGGGDQGGVRAAGVSSDLPGAAGARGYRQALWGDLRSKAKPR